MTREQIIAKWNVMTPRERDAWVAEVVFKWRRCHIGAKTILVPPKGDERWQWAAIYDEYGYPHWLPRYTEDIAAAWTVVDEIRKDYVFQLDDKESGDYTMSIRYGRWKATATTAPEAICLAAIIAKLTTEVVA